MISLLALFLILCIDVNGIFQSNSYGETKLFTAQGTHKDYFGETMFLDLIMVDDFDYFFKATRWLFMET